MSPASSDATPAPTHRLVVVDAANCLYRAFFAIPPLRTADGVPTNAALGFVNMLNKALREEDADHVVVVFDPPDGKSFRTEIDPRYKAQRDAQPEDLSSQFPLVRELIEAYRIPALEIEGFEADDVIATLVERVPDTYAVSIVSTDKDLMQLVGPRVSLVDTMKERRYGPEEVEARFGVAPENLLDVRALAGDPSDNIPGVRGIGEKGAAKLIRQWGTLENLIEHRDEISPTRTRNALDQQVEEARLSKRLAALRRDVPLPVGWDDLARREPDTERLRALLRRLEFTRLLRDLEGDEGAADGAEARSLPVETDVVRDDAGLRRLVEALEAAERPVVVPVGSADNALRDPPVGLAFALGEARATYLPLGHRRLEDAGGVAPAAALETIAPFFRDAGWAGRSTKVLQGFLGEALSAAVSEDEPRWPVGIPGFDVELAAFLLDPAGARTTTALASQHLGCDVPSWESLAGRGARATAPADLTVEETARWAGVEVAAVADLIPLLGGRLSDEGLEPLFRDVELPLTAVLARMECAGVRIDEDALRALSREYERNLVSLEQEIHRLAGEPFQVNSPKQLQHILFEKLKLPVVRKTKTGYSTDEGVLEQLSSQHPLPAQVLAYRRLAKLKSTYVDALPPLVDARTGRIHPTFHQTGAATGRLSSSQPNVQNIPIRSAEGIRIREAFVPAEGMHLLSADYSQVELRILAHFSGDESLLEAFRAGDDIHRRTAAGVLGIEPADVTPDQRARAKAINFGIIYGSTAFGIANQLGIASAEAQETIDAYFARYAGVRRFLDEVVAQAKDQGFVRTLLGRRRYLPDLSSRNRVLRNAAERMAVNTVIQGTAADLMKRAMVDVDRALQDARLGARMILQVHDELVFEAPEASLEALGALARQGMEGAGKLRVPLRVELGTGRNWREAH